MNNKESFFRKKINKLSLSQRLKLTLISGFVVIALIAAIALVFISKSVEDHIFERQLQTIVKQYRNTPISQRKEFSSVNLTIYSDLTQTPPRYQKQLIALDVGFHDVEFAPYEEFHIAVIAEENSTLYFFYDVYDLEISEESEIVIVEITLVLFLLLLIIVLYIFQRTINKAMSPMFKLIAQIKNSDSTTLNNFKNPGLSVNDQEVGLLYRTLDEYSQRLASFIDREREFTSFASHELRTPVTIIKGATELLEMQQQPSTVKQIQRIKRATQEMEDIINVLLSLARERQETNIELENISTLLNNLFETYQQRAEKQGKHFSSQGSISPTLSVPRIHFNITVGNLLINAIKYSEGQEISVHLSNKSISISNAKSNNYQHTKAQGYGLGQIIIRRICEQQEWTFTLKETEQNLTATIEFN